MFEYAVLRGKEVVPCDLDTWMDWLRDNHDKRQLWFSGDQSRCVSTIFMGLNHAPLPSMRPQWFETMVFIGMKPADEYTERYATYDEAEAGHKAIAARALS